MFSIVSRLLRDPSRSSVPPAPPQPPSWRIGDRVPAYPDQTEGIPAAPIDELLGAQAEMIEALRQPIGLTRAEFERLVVPVVRRYAELVHLLPASEHHHHAGLGGLLRHGLEVAWNAARKAEGTVFSAGHDPERQHHLKPRWLLAAALAGLMHDIGKPLCDVAVRDASGSLEWNPYLGPLAHWLATHRIERYVLFWRARRGPRHGPLSLIDAREALGPEVIAFLTEPPAGHEVLDAMFGAIADGNDPTNPLADIVNGADQHSVAEDLLRTATTAVAVGGGSQHALATRLIAAIQELARDSAWRANCPGSPIWVTDEGVFLVYPSVLKEAREHLTRRGVLGVPADPSVLANVLVDHGFCEGQTHANGADSPTWIGEVSLPQQSFVAKLYLLRLTQPSYLFPFDAMPASAPIALAGAAPAPLPIVSSPEPPAPAVVPSPIAAPPVASAQLPLAIDHPAPPARAGNAAWFDAAGHAGAMLHAVAEDLLAGKRAWDEHVYLRNERVWLRYPEAIADYGTEPIKIAEAFRQRGWLEIDPRTPGKLARAAEMDGKPVQVLALTAEPSAQLIAAAHRVADDSPPSAATSAPSRATAAVETTECVAPALASGRLSSAADIAAAVFALLVKRYPNRAYLALGREALLDIVTEFASVNSLDIKDTGRACAEQRLLIRPRNGAAEDRCVDPNYVPPEPALWLPADVQR